mmetsp:Transcript_11085/g.40126  ORF Transcript_11085/g.40126 Transcript_11085/m.40126 type:complete len:230 (-) Transcript_11085:694-1383(-)
MRHVREKLGLRVRGRLCDRRFLERVQLRGSNGRELSDVGLNPDVVRHLPFRRANWRERQRVHKPLPVLAVVLQLDDARLPGVDALANDLELLWLRVRTLKETAVVSDRLLDAVPGDELEPVVRVNQRLIRQGKVRDRHPFLQRVHRELLQRRERHRRLLANAVQLRHQLRHLVGPLPVDLRVPKPRGVEPVARRLRRALRLVPLRLLLRVRRGSRGGVLHLAGSISHHV